MSYKSFWELHKNNLSRLTLFRRKRLKSAYCQTNQNITEKHVNRLVYQQEKFQRISCYLDFGFWLTDKSKDGWYRWYHKELSWAWLIKIMIHDKIQNCSIDKTRIMMIEKSRQKRRTSKDVFFFSKKLRCSLLQTKNTFYQFRSFAPFVTD